jgi:hypothetical protein
MPEVPAAPSPEEAVTAVRRIMRAWELDWSDTMALIRTPDPDFSTVEWTDERLARVAYLVELEKALPKLDPRGSIPRWLSTAKPGPFFLRRSVATSDPDGIDPRHGRSAPAGPRVDRAAVKYGGRWVAQRRGHLAIARSLAICNGNGVDTWSGYVKIIQ